MLIKNNQKIKEKTNSISVEQRLWARNTKTPQVFADQPRWLVRLRFGNHELFAGASSRFGVHGSAQQPDGENSFADPFHSKWSAMFFLFLPYLCGSFHDEMDIYW